MLSEVAGELDGALAQHFPRSPEPKLIVEAVDWWGDSSWIRSLLGPLLEE